MSLHRHFLLQVLQGFCVPTHRFSPTPAAADVLPLQVHHIPKIAQAALVDIDRTIADIVEPSLPLGTEALSLAIKTACMSNTVSIEKSGQGRTHLPVNPTRGNMAAYGCQRGNPYLDFENRSR